MIEKLKELDPNYAYTHWLWFDQNTEWCRYDRLMLEQVYCSSGAWRYRRMNAALAPDPVRRSNEIIYVGSDVVRLAEGRYENAAVRSNDPRLKTTAWKHCGVDKLLQFGPLPKQLNPSKRQGDVQILASIDVLCEQDPAGPLPVPQPWRTVAHNKLASLQLSTGPRVFSWFEKQGVSDVPAAGPSLEPILRKVGIKTDEDRWAFPLWLVQGGGVVVASNVSDDWHKTMRESYHTEGFLINLESWR